MTVRNHKWALAVFAGCVVASSAHAQTVNIVGSGYKEPATCNVGDQFRKAASATAKTWYELMCVPSATGPNHWMALVPPSAPTSVTPPPIPTPIPTPIPVPVVAPASAPVVTTSSATAQINSSVTLTASKPVNWSLAPGSLGTLNITDATHAIYTAPASIPSQASMGGCPVLPNDSIFNTPITSLPVDSRSTAWLSQLQGYAFVPEFLTSPNLITGAYTARSMKFYYGAAGGSYPYVAWPNRKREAGALKSKSDGQDHHTLTVATGANPCQFYEMYNDAIAPTYTFGCQDGSVGCNATSGWTYSPATYAIPGQSTDAAGLPEALAVRLDEIKAGTIHHAMRFTLARGFIQGSGGGATTHALWPSSGGNGWGGANTPPYGARLRLRSTFNVASHSPYAQSILVGLQQYGTMVADVGSNMAQSFASDCWEDPAVAAAVNEAMSAVHGSDFDVVDESGLMVSSGSAQVDATKGAATGYAQVIATDAASAVSATNTPIPLQGVGVGLMNQQVSAIVSGTPYSYDFGPQSWVTGTSNQTLSWTLISGPGSVTSAGVYTLPASITSPTAAVLKATSAADANATATQYINLYPVAADGHFRVSFGASSRLTDGNGNSWWPQAGLETGIFVRDNSGPNPSGNAEGQVYSNVGYTYGADIHVRLIFPNGGYRVRELFGQPLDGCQSKCLISPSWDDPSYIGINGTIVSHNYHWGVQAAEQAGVGWQMWTPGDVTGNVFDFWLGGENPDGVSGNPQPKISAIDIAPDAASPTLTIDTGNEGFDPSGKSITAPLAVAGGATVQLYAIGWHMSNAATWTATAGTIDANGLYTAPASTGTPQSVTVTATSAANNATSATATLTVN